MTTTTYTCELDEIMPAEMRVLLGWTTKHDKMMVKVIREFDLELPRDRELIRQLTFVRIQQGDGFEEASFSRVTERMKPQRRVSTTKTRSKRIDDGMG